MQILVEFQPGFLLFELALLGCFTDQLNKLWTTC